jgi:hypothetical protein
MYPESNTLPEQHPPLLAAGLLIVLTVKLFFIDNALIGNALIGNVFIGKPGKSLSPVFCFVNPKTQGDGSGLPHGGLRRALQERGLAAY